MERMWLHERWNDLDWHMNPLKTLGAVWGSDVCGLTNLIFVKLLIVLLHQVVYVEHNPGSVFDDLFRV